MPRLLTVDDSEIDRVLIRSLLDNQDDVEDLEYEIVGDAREALNSIEKSPPDILVTDLVMPGMDGLELLEAVHANHPLLPVIVVTARGSEETAVTALQQGAASYIPKNNLANLLTETIDSVLSAAQQRRNRTRLMTVMVESRSSFVLENDRTLFRPLLHYLQDTMGEFGLFDAAESMRMSVAIEEALNNAAEHGNLELDSQMREDDFRGYLALMKSRATEPGYRDRRVHFMAHFSPTESVFEIRDEGPGFDRSSVADPQAEDRQEAVSGRGLTLMRAFMDEVEFNDKGNEVRMVKRCPPTPAKTPAAPPPA
tara:strand:+ start:28201 stop:29133 length:933 start_codon:yes stop_codon:yes gene_type:complete